MDSVDVVNRRVATKPLTMNLPDGRKVKSTHVCNITIPGLPGKLTGHIIPALKTASLIGIHPLCKVGCRVVFDNVKCDVVYKGQVILRGYKDPSTNLWTLPITIEGMQTTPSHKDLPQPCLGIGRAPHPPQDISDRAAFLHSIQTRANNVKFAHQLLCNPKISTLLKATQRGFLKRVPIHQRQADQQIPQSKSCNSEGPYETPTPWYSKYYAKSKNKACCTRASRHFPSSPYSEYPQ
jgi:hypothetical protein